MLFNLEVIILQENSIKELLRSKEEKKILTGKISGIEDEYYKIKNENIPCAIIWYEDIKILIPCTHLGITKANKSIIRSMLGAEIDFIIIEIDLTSNIAIASRKDAMELRAKILLKIHTRIYENTLQKMANIQAK